jgi:hypothetical protein
VLVAMMLDNPNGSQEIYHKIRERLGLEEPAGGILYVAGPSPLGSWRVLEVWESNKTRRDSSRTNSRRRARPSRSPRHRPRRRSGASKAF